MSGVRNPQTGSRDDLDLELHGCDGLPIDQLEEVWLATFDGSAVSRQCLFNETSNERVTLCRWVHVLELAFVRERTDVGYSEGNGSVLAVPSRLAQWCVCACRLRDVYEVGPDTGVHGGKGGVQESAKGAN